MREQLIVLFIAPFISFLVPANAADTGTVNISGHVDTGSCTITAGTALTISLPGEDVTDFPSIGSIAGQGAERDITLSCTSNTKVSITYSAELATVGGDSKTILANKGDASGVGVQLLDLSNGSTVPIAMNTAVDISYTGTTVNIPISARYIRTDIMKQGNVSVPITYVIDYQ